MADLSGIVTKKILQRSSYVCVCLLSGDSVLDSCSFRDEEDDCTYHYTVENTKDKDLEVQVLKKKGEAQVVFFSSFLYFCHLFEL